MTLLGLGQSAAMGLGERDAGCEDEAAEGDEEEEEERRLWSCCW